MLSAILLNYDNLFLFNTFYVNCLNCQGKFLKTFLHKQAQQTYANNAHGYLKISYISEFKGIWEKLQQSK